jgi:peptidoglycan/xylan/chitin deacetylase (PgdA/CDA1 family)
VRTAALLVLASCTASGSEPAVEPAPSENEVVIVTASATAAAAAASVTVPATASVSAATATASAEAVDPLVITLGRETIGTDFTKRPFVFSAAFDGSLRYSLWLRTIEHARAMRRKHGRGPHYTFFVNAAFYTTTPGESDVGKAMTHDEVVVRRALTQQAINEGHDIGDHGMGHHDGRNWSKQEWLAEFALFHGVMDTALFEPVPEGEGFAFPHWEPLAAATAGETGSGCKTNDDCSSKRCAELTPEVGLCTQPCNLKSKCPAGTACGAPMFREDKDLCIPLPKLPLVVDGKQMFDARGEPNLKHPKLARYVIKGFRAPYLAANNALYDALSELGYQYDTSQAAGPGAPFFVKPAEAKNKILELALILYPGAAAIPMDYNYAKLGASRETMARDYRAAILGSIERGNQPWNVGHHFAMWNDGAYLNVLEETVDWVLGDCTDDEGKARCNGADVLSLRELAASLGAK